MAKPNYKRKSTQATILIKSRHPGLSHPNDFFSLVFYKAERGPEKAEAIYNAIVLKEGLEFTRIQHNIDKGTFYEILRRLKGVGLISKEKGVYRPSNRFKNRLLDIAGFPEKNISRLEGKHNIKVEFSKDD